MIFAIGAMGVCLSSPPRYGAGEHSFSINTYELYKEHCVLISGQRMGEGVQSAIATDIETAIGHDLATVSDVMHVMTEHAEGNLLVWIVADKPSAETREKIFEKQYALIDAFPDTFFDFNLVSSKGSPNEIASSAKVIFTREG